MISVYNALENDFPVGVMNELRDVFSHMTQSLMAEENTEIERHLDKAYRHIKRSVVDAFKYACMAYSKVYDGFITSYKDVDLSYIDNGQFLPQLVSLNIKAENLLSEAKIIEADIHNDDDMYSAYEAAFNCYAELYNRIMDSLDAVIKLQLRTNEDKKAKEKQHHIDRIIGIVGAIFGVLGVIVAIVIYFLT